MADLAVWQRTIVDEEGNVIPGAEIEVRREEDDSLAMLYADRAGETPLANPLAADMSGFVRFFAGGDAYTITAVGAGSTRTWRFDPTGRLKEFDRISEALVANDAADLVAARSNLGTFSSVAEVQSRHIPAVLESITVNAFRYREGAEAPASIQSADGRWWVPDIPLGFTFNSVAEMQAVAFLPIGAKVRTLGYHEPDDGGGNTYEVVSGGTGTADDGSLIDLLGGLLQARGLFPDGVHLEQFGVREADASILGALMAAGDTAAARTGVLNLDGVYTVAGWWYDYPSGLTLRGTPRAALHDLHIRMEGSAGDPINLTDEVEPGDAHLTLTSTSGLAAGDWLRIVSCINSNSPDAGDFMLGNRTSNMSYLAEFVQIASVDSSTKVALERGTVFPYATTPGPDSGDRTGSVVYPVQFHEGARIENARLRGIPPGQSAIIHTYLARDLLIDDKSVIDTEGEPFGCILADMSLDVILDGTTVRGQHGVTGNATANIVKFRSCQDSFIQNQARIYGGFQSVDVTYYVNSDLGGGPSINCGAIDTVAVGAGGEPYCDHPGTYKTVFKDNSALGCLVSGIRLRGRAARAEGNSLAGKSVAAQINRRGIVVQGIATADSVVRGNQIRGFTRGVIHAALDSVGDFNTPLEGSVSVDITDNIIEDCEYPIFLSATANDPTATVSPRIVMRNRIIRPGQDAITVMPYVNGVFVDHNVITELDAAGLSYAGIMVQGNLSHLTVGDNNVFVAAPTSTGAVGVRGPIAASYDAFITDTNTFPNGDADAKLRIGKIDIIGGGNPIGRMRANPAAFRKVIPPGLQSLFFSVSNAPASPANHLRDGGQAHLYLDESNKRVMLQIRTQGLEAKQVVLAEWT